MLNYSREILVLSGEKTRAEFLDDRLLQLALTRLIEIVGEAANRVSEQTQAQCVSVPWRQIIDTRNRLIHGYDVIDLDILWNTIRIDIPQLAASLEAIAEELNISKT